MGVMIEGRSAGRGRSSLQLTQKSKLHCRYKNVGYSNNNPNNNNSNNNDNMNFAPLPSYEGSNDYSRGGQNGYNQSQSTQGDNYAPYVASERSALLSFCS